MYAIRSYYALARQFSATSSLQLISLPLDDLAVKLIAVPAISISAPELASRATVSAVNPSKSTSEPLLAEMATSLSFTGPSAITSDPAEASSSVKSLNVT